MFDKFKAKSYSIAEMYAQIIEKRLLAALTEDEITSDAMAQINEGIRLLNHIAGTLERIERLCSTVGA